MNTRSNFHELSELEASLTPNAVRQWLASQEWNLSKEKPGVAELWTSTSGTPGGINDVFLPLNREYSDHARRFRSLLLDLQRAYKMSLEALAEEISSVSADIFFIRVGQTAADGTIPFKQATSLLSSVQKMVKAAATTAANPRHTHQGRLPAQVTEFIDDDLRFGHTKRGSFIITIAARLDPTDTPSQPEQPALQESQDEGESSKHKEHLIKPFSRQVMETLASGLTATKHHVISENEIEKYEDFDEARERGMSLQLVQSLVDVGKTDGISSVDLSFQWASAGPPPPKNIEPSIHITAEDLPRMEKLRDRFVRKEEAVEETLIGRVAELGRDEISGTEESWITLEAEFKGRNRKFRVELDSSDYDWALYAHQHRLPLTVSGTPIRRQRWSLEGAIKVDTRFLRDFSSTHERTSPSNSDPPDVHIAENSFDRGDTA